MYYQANDNELIYLIKDGNSLAYRTLYKKYEHLIFKIYKDTAFERGVVLNDFMQEGFMCLEQAIWSYQDKYRCTFYSYFLILFKRKSFKLFKKNSLNLKENFTEYKTEVFFNSKSISSSFISALFRQLNLKSDLEKDLFYECLLNNVKITQIAKKYNMKYDSVYGIYKKIKQKVEKILTNDMV